MNINSIFINWRFNKSPTKDVEEIIEEMIKPEIRTPEVTIVLLCSMDILAHSIS